MSQDKITETIETLCEVISFCKDTIKSIKFYKARAERLQDQLPEGMKHCTILVKQCELGHSWLTATNWVQHGCPTCEINKLREQLSLQQEQPKPAFKDYPIPQSVMAAFAETEYLVEATDFEYSTLWETWHKRVSSWQQSNIGCLQPVGELGNRPINISVVWAFINNHRILFWHCVSEVADYGQINNWFACYCSRPRTNAQNFHVALQHLKINYSTNGL